MVPKQEKLEGPPLTLVGETAQQIASQLQISPNASAPISVSCGRCFDTGKEIVEGEGARPCPACIKRGRIAAIPLRFSGVKLEDLQPLNAKHARQAEAIAYMRKHPDASYFFAGSPGTGKTLFMWALYRQAVEDEQAKVVITTLAGLLDEYRAFIRANAAGDNPRYPRLSAEELNQGERRYSIFLDDVDKANPTDYAAEQIFAIVNAIYEHKHQLVVTTNKSIKELIAHFDRSDDRGGPIVRRMLDGAKVFEMF